MYNAQCKLRTGLSCSNGQSLLVSLIVCELAMLLAHYSETFAKFYFLAVLFFLLSLHDHATDDVHGDAYGQLGV